MFKKVLSLVLVIAMAATAVFGLVSCKKTNDDFKVGFIFLHDENSTYDKNFLDAAKAAAKAAGLKDDQILMKTNVPESDKCYEAAAELVEEGCKLIFADSFGHEDHIIRAAGEFKDVQFFHATGTKAHTLKLDNFHNAFASIYEGRYLAGIAAGMKIQEMIDKGETINGVKVTAENAKIGYVGAFDYAEVVSGLTSFFLGARSVCSSVTMEVTYTGAWFDIALEKEAANKLMNDGCILISQHADSEGAPKACEEKGVPNVAYNISTISIAPNTALISSKINWEPYMTMIIKETMAGNKVDNDICYTIKDGAVELTELNSKVAAEGTQTKIDEAMAKLKDGSLKVFDTSTFTYKGEKLTSYKADVDTDDKFTPDTEVVKDGYFAESSFRAAPYFDLKYIDGITEMKDSKN